MLRVSFFGVFVKSRHVGDGPWFDDSFVHIRPTCKPGSVYRRASASPLCPLAPRGLSDSSSVRKDRETEGRQGQHLPLLPPPPRLSAPSQIYPPPPRPAGRDPSSLSVWQQSSQSAAGGARLSVGPRTRAQSSSVRTPGNMDERSVFLPDTVVYVYSK